MPISTDPQDIISWEERSWTTRKEAAESFDLGYGKLRVGIFRYLRGAGVYPAIMNGVTRRKTGVAS